MDNPQPSRRRRADLLSRPPCGVGGTAAGMIDPVAQLRELADLVARDLLSPEEFERLKQRVVGPDVAIPA
jgi:hypothetical protein